MNDAQHPLNALPQGHRLQEYELIRVLGFGGFGMTYLGFDHNLDKAVALKEYLPADIATRTDDNSVAPQASQFRGDFEWGLERFLDEARTLARFDHRHIIKVHRFFEAHGTAYIVMEYAEGETLSAYLDRKWTLKEEELKAILNPILDGLEVVHAADFLHRDIKPGNIIIRDEDGSPVLLDFGAARQAIGARSKSVTSIITPGYAPIEQYSTQGDQGPWTDVYALGALCYRALTGEAPADATERVIGDTLIPVSARCAGRADAGFLKAIDWAIKVDKAERPQSVAAWRDALSGVTSDDVPSPAPARAGEWSSGGVRGAGAPASAPGHRATDDRPATPKKRKGPVFAAVVVCALALLIGGYYAYYKYIYLPDQRRRAQEAVIARQTAAEDVAKRRREAQIASYTRHFEKALGERELDHAGRYLDSLRAVGAPAGVLSGKEGRLSAAREADRLRQEHRKVGRKFRDCGECPQMVVVPSGSFMMGSPDGESGRNDDEGPRQRVRIDYRFAVGVYEVTFAEWDACANAGGCGGYRPDDRGWGRGNRPVINVGWEDAQSYVQWLSERSGQRYRLLSESEWEYVARAGTTTPFHFGTSISTAQANYDGNYRYGSGRKGRYREKTVSVGSFSPNGWGVHDVHGNVWEWVEDCWNGSYTGAPADGSAWERGECSPRVLRGGSWLNRPMVLRSAYRGWNTTGVRNNIFGFRIARTLTP